MEKKRILWISDSPSLPTGNGKITKYFVEELCKGDEYEIAVLGRGFSGWPGERERFGCCIYPMDIERPYPEIMQAISREFRPQVVISCLDMWQIDWIEHAKLGNAVTNIGYISIYGNPAPLSWKKVVKNLDLAICYSEFGRNVLREFMPFTSIEMIHLGVDTEIYKPLKNKDELKRKRNLEGKFVVGCIARNQLRKRFDKLIEGFALFASGNKDAHLYIKTEAVSEHGYILPDLIDYHGISDKVTIDEKKTRTGHDESIMNELYNTFDVYAQSAGAEGFGIPILEAMSCGIPVIIPDYSACSELVNGNGLLLKPYFHRVVDMATVEQVSIDTVEFAAHLEELYSNPEKRAQMGKKGRMMANTMTWKKFSRSWEHVLKKVRWE